MGPEHPRPLQLGRPGRAKGQAGRGEDGPVGQAQLGQQAAVDPGMVALGVDHKQLGGQATTPGGARSSSTSRGRLRSTSSSLVMSSYSRARMPSRGRHGSRMTATSRRSLASSPRCSASTLSSSVKLPAR